MGWQMRSGRLSGEQLSSGRLAGEQLSSGWLSGELLSLSICWWAIVAIVEWPIVMVAICLGGHLSGDQLSQSQTRHKCDRSSGELLSQWANVGLKSGGRLQWASVRWAIDEWVTVWQRLSEPCVAATSHINSMIGNPHTVWKGIWYWVNSLSQLLFA